MRSTFNFFILLLLSLTATSTTSTVKKVIDGDTFLTEKNEKVRMLGINAKERQEWYYQEAKDYLRRLIEGKQVQLTPDGQSPNKDQHGRLLRYVELNDTDINKKMILDGYAYAFLRYPIDRNRLYEAAEKQARRKKIGLWSDQDPRQQTANETIDDQPGFLLFGIFGFILLVVLIQTWRYFK